ncbi:abortive infection family protein [Methyloversatilis sp.]|uniref:abortive infection family protein n=1 Tax=Methyloversatilis sp. TaxID=2569862 RepID=UPI003F6FFD26
MQKIRDTLVQYSRWDTLGDYVDRMEAHLEADFSTALENAKALLESIGKEICSAKAVALEPSSPIQGVLKKAFAALGYPGDDMVRQVSTALATIGQNVGELRNQISPTSHGKPLDELRDRNNKVDLLTREFLIDSTLVVAVFLIRAFEERQAVAMPLPATQPLVDDGPSYDDNEDFNNFWDESFGEFGMGDYNFTASEVLFALDSQAYAVECKAFKELGDESAGEAMGDTA